MGLTGKVALVTGGGRGIGRACAVALAGSNAKVAVAARSKSEIDEVARVIVSTGHQAEAFVCDITDEQDVMQLFDEAQARLGPVDIVVNNAGILKLKSVSETSLEEWNSIIRVNLTGAFLVAREAMRRMRERGGCLINIGSLAGRRGYSEQGAYCASKHGLAGLTKVLAIEGQKWGIRVHLVSPGGVLTGLSAELRDSRGSEASEWMTPEEVAEAVVFCACQNGVAISDEIVLRRFSSEPWR